jgi:molybdopterin-guanine dinucleotide biosynthesis protein B
MARPTPIPPAIQAERRTERDSNMKILGIAGWSGGGKTTLLKSLIPALIGRGVSVSTLKHAHHAFDLDKPGKDSHAHREAGAREVLISSTKRWALLHENQDEAELDLEAMLGRLSPVDLVLVEGFKHHPHDKIAIASDIPFPDAGVPVFNLDDIKAIADFVMARTGLGEDWAWRRGVIV